MQLLSIFYNNSNNSAMTCSVSTSMDQAYGHCYKTDYPIYCLHFTDEETEA